MRHIAIAGLRGIPDVMGGIETHCAELLPAMHAQSSDLRLTVLARRRYVGAPGTVRGVAQVPLAAPAASGAEALVHSHWAVLYARFALGADAIHLHGIGPGLAVPLARLLRLRVLFTHHGEDYARAKWGRTARTLLRLGERLAVRFSHQTVTVSASTAARLKARAGKRAGRITHIPNGITPPRSGGDAEAVMARHGLTPGRFIIQVGRLEPEKGHDTLIAAYRASGLAHADPPVKLLVVGDADHESAHSRKVRAMAGDGVEFAGRLDRDTILRLDALAALFVLPSHHEGLSISALEALSVGAPVLLSDIEPNRNIGLAPHHYLPPGDIDAWTEALRLDPRRFEVRTGFDVTRYDWDDIARRTLAVLDALPWRHPRLPLATETARDG
ncbi:putative capsular polysaccharide bisynthesis glycosyl transferase [Oceanicola granulosus HTCC2516]|uniref:Putative capsular polysaccharide bisynthesis glycosyl transferase n=1 Tax=Oceanicola granulosus (strain ATCC BAA-861 / DSM 15982 / KCTC 12143 / HTCC2516) TaxID=314256 RepID=Q2CER5_OCEGH|nr:glycosyltransferase family 4 protein [Oceanicola granulosus]EAR51193.1 putative capsular polysaccharide bisynthesis glycosyl transferase [Oceanicola granulosus HTCC2516]